MFNFTVIKTKNSRRIFFKQIQNVKYLYSTLISIYFLNMHSRYHFVFTSLLLFLLFCLCHLYVYIYLYILLACKFTVGKILTISLNVAFEYLTFSCNKAEVLNPSGRHDLRKIIINFIEPPLNLIETDLFIHDISDIFFFFLGAHLNVRFLVYSNNYNNII